MDAHLMIKERHNQCMKKARAAVARLWVLTMMHVIICEGIHSVQIALVQAVTLN